MILNYYGTYELFFGIVFNFIVVFLNVGCIMITSFQPNKENDYSYKNVIVLLYLVLFSNINYIFILVAPCNKFLYIHIYIQIAIILLLVYVVHKISYITKNARIIMIALFGIMITNIFTHRVIENAIFIVWLRPILFLGLLIVSMICLRKEYKLKLMNISLREVLSQVEDIIFIYDKLGNIIFSNNSIYDTDDNIFSIKRYQKENLKIWEQIEKMINGSLEDMIVCDIVCNRDDKTKYYNMKNYPCCVKNRKKIFIMTLHDTTNIKEIINENIQTNIQINKINEELKDSLNTNNMLIRDSAKMGVLAGIKERIYDKLYQIQISIKELTVGKRDKEELDELCRFIKNTIEEIRENSRKLGV